MDRALNQKRNPRECPKTRAKAESMKGKAIAEVENCRRDSDAREMRDLSRHGDQGGDAFPAKLGGNVLCLRKEVDFLVEEGRGAPRAERATVDGRCCRGSLGAAVHALGSVVLDGVRLDSDADDDCARRGRAGERHHVLGTREAAGDGLGDALGGDEMRLCDMVGVLDVVDRRVCRCLTGKRVCAVCVAGVELVEVATCNDDG